MCRLIDCARAVLLSVALGCGLLVVEAAADTQITLRCQLGTTRTVLEGRNGEAKLRSSYREIETIDIDLDNSTYAVQGLMQKPNPLAAVSDFELTLTDYSGTYRTSRITINRDSGQYIYESNDYDPGRNETTVIRSVGMCDPLRGGKPF